TEEHNKNEIVELVLSSLISCDSSNETLLEKELQKVNDEPDKNKIKEIFNNVFKSLDNDILKKQEGYEFEDSVGDSPTYAGYKNEQIRRITANHNLDNDGKQLNLAQSGLIEINNQDIDFILDVEIFLRDSVKKFKEDNEEETKAASFLMGKNGFYDEETDDATFVSIFFKQSKDETVKDLYKRINNKKFKYWGSLDKEEKFAYRKSIFSNMTNKKNSGM
ncbi:15360_t:CDS:2, partial [Racocetra fulgida]